MSFCDSLYPSLPQPQIQAYVNWLADQRGLHFDSYEALWEWSVSDLEAFWRSIWDYFDIRSTTPPERVLAQAHMPGAQWFPGVRLNIVDQYLRHVQGCDAAGHPAVVFVNEALLARAEVQEWTLASSASATVETPVIFAAASLNFSAVFMFR
mgnify:CR=1 FL=1